MRGIKWTAALAAFIATSALMTSSAHAGLVRNLLNVLPTHVVPPVEIPRGLLPLLPGCSESNPGGIYFLRECQADLGAVAGACYRQDEFRGYFMDRSCALAVRAEGLAADAACAQAVDRYLGLGDQRSCGVAVQVGEQRVAAQCEHTYVEFQGTSDRTSCDVAGHRLDCVEVTGSAGSPTDECTVTLTGTPLGTCRLTVLGIHALQEPRIDVTRSGCALRGLGTPPTS
ncbi:hypothetical protein [Conexibacter sp. SYSU D00693]|uniref:hypothetical protein n=1 Tax=Conexibacter sp. SYSU D00693 TaxID=2812560 RepID=UPI00196A7146|nr:hypothetical protein [Conexibacter sp. SYSU D00693]